MVVQDIRAAAHQDQDNPEALAVVAVVTAPQLAAQALVVRETMAARGEPPAMLTSEVEVVALMLWDTAVLYLRRLLPLVRAEMVWSG
jgi:hypothetical protein